MILIIVAKIHREGKVMRREIAIHMMIVKILITSLPSISIIRTQMKNIKECRVNKMRMMILIMMKMRKKNCSRNEKYSYLLLDLIYIH